MRGNLYIPSIDAKDLYLANNYINKSPYGYKLTRKDNSENLRKYINSFDYSLDLIELREVANKVYGELNKKNKKDENRNPESLSFIINDKEYSSKVINITFKYSVKEYNRISKGFYVKNGYNPEEIKLNNNGYALNKDKTELIAIQLDTEYLNVIEDLSLLPNCFECKSDGIKYKYILKREPKTIISSKNLRKWAYEEGFICNGIKYCRFKRSSGSSRVGKCLFIDSRLYPLMHKSEKCGLEIKDGQELDIAAFEAYISLPTSSIIDYIEIKPENILVIEDWESHFKDIAICTDLDKNNWLTTCEKEMDISNSIWDGQSLIDSSLMGNYKNRGMLLLRNKFFKSCCFNTNIQQFFKDNNITDISQLNGKTVAKNIEDIKLITTPSSIKFLKFGNLKTWLKNIYSIFGIVKYDKNTHYFNGRLVQAHYQLLNTLQLSYDDVKKLVKDGLDYVNYLNTDTDIMRYHLGYKNRPDNDDEKEIDNIMKDKNEVVYKLLGLDCGFEKTDIYYKFKEKLCSAYLKNMKRGHILINGTYATLFGNPYEMLLQSIGKFDGTSIIKPGTVHNVRFPYDIDLLCSRSPHVTIGNILVTKNVKNDIIDKYFNLTNNIICINSINENILERLSGADFDSDSMIITDNKILVDAAKKNYHIFKVPTRNINPPKSKRHYTPEDLFDLDEKTSNNKIGEIVNLSQELNSLLWDIIYHSGESVESQYESVKEIYYDVCQLDVMSNIEIDKAKKEYPVDMKKELDKIRNKYASLLYDEDNRKSMPYFLGFIAEIKDYKNEEKKNYKKYNTSMDYLLTCIDGKRSKRVKRENLPLSEIFKPENFDKKKVWYKHIDTVIDLAKNTVAHNKALYRQKNLSKEEINTYKEQAASDLLFKLNRLKINEHTMYYLLKKLESDKDMSVRNYLFYILFNYKNETLTSTLKRYNTLYNILEEDKDGDINIYGKSYKKSDF